MDCQQKELAIAVIWAEVVTRMSCFAGTMAELMELSAQKSAAIISYNDMHRN